MTAGHIAASAPPPPATTPTKANCEAPVKTYMNELAELPGLARV
jgi:hypothetical protein